jgi:PAS domain S-box-containing protein
MTDPREPSPSPMLDERRCQRLIDLSHVGVWVLDAAARTTFANPRARAILGAEGDDELLGATLFEFVHPDAQFHMRSQFARWQRGFHDTWELPLRRRDGSAVWVHATASPDSDGDAPVGGVSLVMSDVTDRRTRDDQARVALEMFRGIADQAITGQFLVADGHFVYVNPRMAEIFGYTVDEMLALPDTLALADSADHALASEMIRRRLHGARQVEYAGRGIRKDGTVFHYEVYGTQIVYAGRPAMMGTLLDVTSRFQAEAARTLAEQEFESLSSMAPIGIFRWTLDARITSVNPHLGRIFGGAEEMILGHNWLDAVPEAQREHVLNGWAAAAQLGEEYAAELPITRLDGAERLLRLHAVPLADASGGVVGAVGTVDDITERDALEERARQTQKMEAVGRLAGGMAHDFNNLLTAISGYAELLERQLPAGTTAFEDLAAIRESAAKGAALTHRLLSFSRTQVIRETLVDVNIVVAGAEGLLRRLIGEDVRIETVLGPLDQPVRIDVVQLEQVLINLAVNARDAMPGGGRLIIRSAYHTEMSGDRRTRLGLGDGEYVSVCVEDTGTGMDAATRKRVFEPFFTTKQSGKSTGLGLATVYGIVRAAGGAIHVESELRRGSRFTVYLPAVEGEAVAVVEPIPTGRKRGHEIILLVEDEPKLREIIRRVLVDNGYAVVEAPNGLEALSIARQRDKPFDLVLSDVVMPGLSGGALLRELDLMGYTGKVMLMSGYAEDNAQLRDALRGGTTLLQKPFTPDQLTRQVRAVLDAL